MGTANARRKYTGIWGWKKSRRECQQVEYRRGGRRAEGQRGTAEDKAHGNGFRFIHTRSTCQGENCIDNRRTQRTVLVKLVALLYYTGFQFLHVNIKKKNYTHYI